MSDVHSLAAGIIHKLGIFLVDSIICEMNKLLFQIMFVWFYIRFGSKSC